MTVTLSPPKVSKLIRLYFEGMPQLKIAKKLRIDQSSVSNWSNRFKDLANEIGLLDAGREFDVLDEVDALRSLSVELRKEKLSVEDAKQGFVIVKKFKKYGISTEKHSVIIRVCNEVNKPEFIHYVIRLMEIEQGSHLSYEDTIRRFEDAAQKLPSTEDKLFKKEQNIKSLGETMGQKQQALAELEFELTQFKKKTEVEKNRIQSELEDERKRLRVKCEEVNEVFNLKSMLRKRDLDIPTLIRLAKEFQQ